VRAPPVLVVLAGVVFTSFSSIFVRLSTAPPLVIAAYRMVFTTVLLMPLLLREIAADRRRHPGAGNRPHFRNDSSTRVRAGGRTRDGHPRIVMLSVLSGILLSFHFAAWITSLSYTSVASSTVLVTTHPIIVAIAGFLFLGERLSGRAVTFMLGALAGGLVLVVGGLGAGGSATLGNLLAFLGAVTISGYMLIGRFVRQHLSANRYTSIVYSVAAILLTSYALIAGNPLLGYAPRELLIFLALAVVCTLLGHSLFNWALRYVRPTTVSTSILGEPVIASILAWILFLEIPTVYTVVGGVMILVSIFLFVREENRTRRERATTDADRV